MQTTYTKQMIFSALRHHKQTRKTSLMDMAITEDMDASIQKTKEFVETQSQKQKKKVTTKACKLMATMLSKEIYSYFHHWAVSNSQHKQMVNSKIKGLVIKYYQKSMTNWLLQWKKNSVKAEKTRKRKRIQTVEMESEQLQSDIIQTTKKNKEKAQAVSSSKKKLTNKSINILGKRLMREGLITWKK